MLIAKLSISYDRGVKQNAKKDLGASFGKTDRTEDGKIIRGLGTHFITDAEMVLVKARDQEAHRVRNEFRARFLATPLDGVYVMPAPGIGKRFVSTMGIRDDVHVFVTEFTLESAGGMDGHELAEWGTRIKKQLGNVSLGRSKEADDAGLNALVTLSKCPVLSKSTGSRIRELVAMLKDGKQTRIEVKRSLDTMEIEIEQSSLAPRKTPALVK